MSYHLSLLAERTEAILVGFGALWAGMHLLSALVLPRRRRRST